MKLYQKESSYNSILNNTYVDDTGRAIYKVHTLHPNSLAGPGTTTISKVYYSTARDSVPVISPSKLPVSPSEDVTPENAEGLNKPSVMDEEYELAVAAESEEDPDFTSSSGPSSALQFRGKRNSGGSQSRVSIKGNGSLDDDADPSEHQSSSTTPNQGVEDRPHDASDFPLEHIAQIDWKVFKSSRLRFGDGKEVLAKDFFRKETWGWYGRHLVFKASDGVEYKWVLGAWVPSLRTNDAMKTPVATFHRRKYGIFSKSEPAYLEIHPAGEHMLDELFITFIFVERIRKEKERAAQSSSR